MKPRYRIPTLDALKSDSLAILTLMKPAPDLLVVGTGDDFVPLPMEVETFLRSEVC